MAGPFHQNQRHLGKVLLPILLSFLASLGNPACSKEARPQTKNSAEDLALGARRPEKTPGTGGFPEVKPIEASGDILGNAVARSQKLVEDCFDLGREPMLERVMVYKKIKNQKLASGQEQNFDLRLILVVPPGHVPGQSEKLPAVVFYHGGGWAAGSPAYWLAAARYFAARGAVTAAVEYRITNHHNSTATESTADALSALRWLRTYSDVFAIDPSRIYTVGDSAGGHLALATSAISSIPGENDGSAMPAPSNGAVAFYPIARPSANAPAPFPQFGGSDLEAFKSIDPFEFISKDNAKPTLILHSRNDTVTYYGHSDDYINRLKSFAPNGDFSLPLYPGGHTILSDASINDGSMVHIDNFLIRNAQYGGLTSDTSNYIKGAKGQCRFTVDQYLKFMEEYGMPDYYNP